VQVRKTCLPVGKFREQKNQSKNLTPSLSKGEGASETEAKGLPKSFQRRDFTRRAKRKKSVKSESKNTFQCWSFDQHKLIVLLKKMPKNPKNPRAKKRTVIKKIYLQINIKKNEPKSRPIH
jgi:hypothetical protein